MSCPQSHVAADVAASAATFESFASSDALATSDPLAWAITTVARLWAEGCRHLELDVPTGCRLSVTPDTGSEVTNLAEHRWSPTDGGSATPRCRRPTSSLLVANSLVLPRAAVENLASGGVALEPRLATLELTSALDGPDSMSTPRVLSHLCHLLSDEPWSTVVGAVTG